METMEFNILGNQSIRSFFTISKTGYYLIILAAIFSALIHVLGKPLLGSGQVEDIGINPIVLAATIYFISGLFFTPISRKCTPIQKIGTRNLMIMAFIGIAEVLALITYFFGLKDATAINASIFSNGEIVFSFIIAITIFRERLRKSEMTPFLLVIFGMMVLPVGYDFYANGMTLSNIVMGDLLIVLSGLLYAADINLCKYVSDRLDSRRITQITSFASGGFALVLLIAFQIPFDLELDKIPTIIVISIIGTGVPTLMFLMALRRIGTVRTILLYSTSSIFGVIFSALFLSEEITFINIISIVIVMLGLYFLRKRLGKDENKDSADLKFKPLNAYKSKWNNMKLFCNFSWR